MLKVHDFFGNLVPVLKDNLSTIAVGYQHTMVCSWVETSHVLQWIVVSSLLVMWHSIVIPLRN